MNRPPDLGTLGAGDLIQQHALVPKRPLHSRVKDSPHVMVAILAKQKEAALPLYLDCIEALDYPKSSITLYVRTNNNTDRTEQILREWVARVRHLYHAVEFDASDVAEKVEQYREHEWNATRFSVLGRIRNQSMRRALELSCDFYFVADVDNFIRPATLPELVALDLPIVAPLLRSIAPGEFYSNYHAEIDAAGYYRACDQYFWLLERRVRGVVEVPVVHCTYLVRADVAPNLTYEDATNRHEYVVFSDSARKAGIPQYLDNRQVYGYISFGEGHERHVADGMKQARALLSDHLLEGSAGIVPLPDLPHHDQAGGAAKSRRQKICLAMIVKDEARVIARCLNSVRPLIDYWVIVDTGSTDGTQDIVRKVLHDIPGELHESPWVDFAHNRSEALKLARPNGDYTFVIDADDVLELPDGYEPPFLSADSYEVEFRHKELRYSRTQLFRNSLPWRFEGVLHEFPSYEGPDNRRVLPEERSHKWLPGARIRMTEDGARRQVAASGRYRRDAELLERALATETDPFLTARYKFYYAQSCLNAGEKEKALAAYLERAKLGYWDQEVFLSLYKAAQIKAELDFDEEEVIASFLKAHKVRKDRAEALHGAARFCRAKQRYQQGYELAKRALEIKRPDHGLALEDWIYDFGVLDEYAVTAFWTGRYAECADACDRLLSEGKLPAEMHDRVRKNAEFAADKIRLQRAPTPPLPEGPAKPRSTWVPQTPSAGTELMVADLRKRMGVELDRINLQVNHPGHDKNDGRPRVVWMHHDVNQSWVQWCKDRELVDSVDCFVFVSYWQRERYINTFRLPPERCFVLRHALDPGAGLRRWEPGSICRCAYTSTPFRGLSVLLDAWQRLSPANAELHIWSSMKLYLADDGPYEHLYKRAESMPGVIYHGIAPNHELRAALRDMHFLAYPCTFEETACLAVIEAMAAGCRVIVPSFGALPETTGGYARIYPWNPDPAAHAAAFATILAEELQTPWMGQPEQSIAQQQHCAAVYDWPRRLDEWRQLIESLARARGRA